MLTIIEKEVKMNKLNKLVGVIILGCFAITAFGKTDNQLVLTALPQNTLKNAEFSCSYALPLKNNKTGKIVALDAHNGFFIGINNQQFTIKNREWDGSRLTGAVNGYQIVIKRAKRLKEQHEYLRALVHLNFYQNKKLIKNFPLIETCEH